MQRAGLSYIERYLFVSFVLLHHRDQELRVRGTQLRKTLEKPLFRVVAEYRSDCELQDELVLQLVVLHFELPRETVLLDGVRFLKSLLLTAHGSPALILLLE